MALRSHDAAYFPLPSCKKLETFNDPQCAENGKYWNKFNNFSVKSATKVVYTSLEPYFYELNDRSKFFLMNQISRGLGTNICIWAHQPKTLILQ